MKLLVIIVQDADAARLRDALSVQKIPFTKLAATGGFLRRGTCTFFSGVPDAQVEQVKGDCQVVLGWAYSRYLYTKGSEFVIV